MKKIILGLVFAVCAVPMAWASTPVGKISALVGNVTALGVDGTSRKLVAGGDVFQNDKISTGPAAKTQIIFNDDSIITIGKDAEMVLDEYVYQPESQSGKSFVSMTKGVFKFVTGKIAKSDPEKVKMNTPFATIGVRGSGGIVEVAPSGLTTLSMTDCCINIKPKGDSNVPPVELTKVNTFTTVSSATSKPTEPKPVPMTDLLRLSNEVAVEEGTAEASEGDDITPAGAAVEDSDESEEVEAADESSSEASAEPAASEPVGDAEVSSPTEEPIIQLQAGDTALAGTTDSLTDRFYDSITDGAREETVNNAPVEDSTGTGGGTVVTPPTLSLVDNVLTNGTSIGSTSQGFKRVDEFGAVISTASIDAATELTVAGISYIAFELSDGSKFVFEKPAAGTDVTRTGTDYNYRVINDIGGNFLTIMALDPSSMEKMAFVVGDEVVDKSSLYGSTILKVYDVVLSKNASLTGPQMKMFLDAYGSDPKVLGGHVKFGGSSGSVMKMFQASVSQDTSGDALTDGTSYTMRVDTGAMATNHEGALSGSKVYGDFMADAFTAEMDGQDMVAVQVDATTAADVANRINGSTNNPTIDAQSYSKLYSAGFVEKTDQTNTINQFRVTADAGSVHISDVTGSENTVNAVISVKSVDAVGVDDGQGFDMSVNYANNSTVSGLGAYGAELSSVSTTGYSYINEGGAMLSSEFVDTTGITQDCKECQHLTWGVWAMDAQGGSGYDHHAQIIPYVAGKPTDIMALPSAISTGTFTYNGILAGSVKNGMDVTNHLGDFSSDVNFATRNVENFTGDFAGYTLQSTGTAPINTPTSGFQMTLDNAAGTGIASGSIQGTVFGPQAEELGGQFTFDSTDGKEAAGIFAGKR